AVLHPVAESSAAAVPHQPAGMPPGVAYAAASGSRSVAACVRRGRLRVSSPRGNARAHGHCARLSERPRRIQVGPPTSTMSSESASLATAERRDQTFQMCATRDDALAWLTG